MRRSFLVPAALSTFLFIGFGSAAAQSTDGFHAIQVIPVVVDTASYKTRLIFSNPSSSARTLRAYYIPAEGTSQATELDCGTFTMAAGQARSFASLREICAALPAGSQFGTLHTMIAAPVPQTGVYSYAAYARVENPQGIGFSVEAFPAHTFTGAQVEVAGLRRLSAAAGSPAYQTNCFVGSLHHEQTNIQSLGTTVAYDLIGSDANLLASGELQVPLGKMLRVLDIFGQAGLPPGDYDNARVIFYRGGTPAVVAFCTVQDNTSFGADFRIGKQFYGSSMAQGGAGSPFAQDDHVNRRTSTSQNIALTDGAGGLASQAFVIPANGSSNAHLLQLRKPDWISCDVVQPGSQIPLSKLEIRLMENNNVIAGGNDVNYFAPVYLGDKYDYVGTNSRYVLEVEGTEPGAGVDTPYMVRCRSGSGHSIPDLVRSGGPNQF